MVVAVALLTIESQETFSAAQTSDPLRAIWQAIFGPVSDWDWGGIHAMIRKAGHLTGFGFIGITFFRAWFLTFRARWGRLRTCVSSAGLAILCSVALASADEFHQSFLPDRTSSAFDVLIDSTGASVALLLAGLYLWLRHWFGATRERDADLDEAAESVETV